MKLGVTLRNMGPQSSPDILFEGAKAADELGFESLWVTDHIAIPPDDAEGSGGRYLDPLVTLGVLAGATRRIKLGTGVLILPYRPALPTAKQVATLQELSARRLLLGIGVGWMDAEFKALGLDRRRRGRDTDQVLDFLHSCFAESANDGEDPDLMTANGQPFLFRPRPPLPPVYVGGRAPHALHRAARSGAGWLPMGGEPDDLARQLKQFDDICAERGVHRGPVTLMRALPLTEHDACVDLLTRYESLGVERLVCALRYDTVGQYRRQLDLLARHL